MPELSIVIPVFNEAESLRKLHAELSVVLEANKETYEILFVDDGSTDGSTDILRALCTVGATTRVLRLPRNQGKSAAYSAGFQAARGRVVVTLDADLQDDPAEIPGMLETLREGHDLVVGWKQNRLNNEPNKAVPSKIFNALLRKLFDVNLHDSNSGFRAMSALLAKRLRLYGDHYRFLPELAHLMGFRVTERPVGHRRREHGVSKYGPMRFWTGFLDMLSLRFSASYQEKPIQLFGTLSLPFITIGVGLEIYALASKLAGEPFQQHLAAIILGVLMLMIGMQFIATGLVAVMLASNNSQAAFSIAAAEEITPAEPDDPR